MADIAGLPLMGLPEKFTPLAAVAVVKMLNDEGEVQYTACATDGLTTVEAIGMIRMADHVLMNGGEDG